MRILLILLVLCSSAYAQTGGKLVTSRNQTPTISQSNPFAALDQIIIDDLVAANEDAKAHQDMMASTCYEALIPVVQQRQAVRGASGGKIGAFVLFQHARDVRRAVSAGIPDNISSACAPLVLDAERTLLMLGGMVGLKLLP